VGTVIVMFTPIEQYQNFLYLIGSFFVPMATILITDYFVLRKRENTNKQSYINAVLFIIGFVIYRVFLGIDTILGSTIPVILIVFVLSIIVNLGFDMTKKEGKKNV